MKITSDFEDTEGRWTPEKRERARKEVSERCRTIGHTDQVAVQYDEPVGQPYGSGPTVFRYRAYAEIPE